MDKTEFNFQDFDQKWTRLGKEICRALYVDPKVQELKFSLEKKGFLTLEEKSHFIELCNLTKYSMIYSKFGKEGSKGYKQFSRNWDLWFKQKGVQSQQNLGQQNSVYHILLGSTPDPGSFLLHFEEEMLGSLKE